jgi:Tol biopolymer transport system component
MKKKRGILILALVASLVILAPGKATTSQQTAGESFEKALYAEEGQGDLQKAIALYQDIVKRFPGEREIAAKALLHIGMCYEKLGKTEARNAYSRLLKDYGDQLQLAKEARSRLAKLETVVGGAPHENAGLVFRKLEVADVGRSHQARLSPDGSKLLYIGYQDKEPRYNLRVLDFASGKSLTLVEGIDANVGTLIFEWSPDGKRVVFKPSRGELRLIDSAGGKAEPLWSSAEKDTAVYPLDWSDQNHAILIALVNYTEKSARLAILPEKGGEPRIVVSGQPNDLADIAQFSPDGRLIVGMRSKERNTDVYVWSVDGSGETRVTDHPADDEYPLWSPDGKFIVFTSNRAKTVDLWAVPMAGSQPAGDPIRIQADLGKNRIPVDFTRSGQLLFYAMRSAGTPPDLFVIPVDAKTGEARGSFRPFARYPTQTTFLRWSPDGSRITYTSRKGNIQLPNAYVSSGGTQEDLEIPARGYFMGNLEWSRDGKSLLFPGWNNEDGRVGIFRISLESSQIEPVQPLGERYGANFKGAYINIRWLPLAGKYMFARLLGENEGEGVEELFLMDPADYRIERIGEKFGISGWGIPSPDGRYLIAANFKEKKITLLTIPDGMSRYLCAFLPDGWPSFSWSPDGKRLVWGEGRWLKSLSVLDGTIQTLVEAGPDQKLSSGLTGTPNTAWSPDGTKIAYALQGPAAESGVRGELWIVDASGGSPRKIADAPASHPRLGEVVWHPSGKMIFAQGQAGEGTGRMFEHWVMENFLPAPQAGLGKNAREFQIRKVWGEALDTYFMGAPSPDGKLLSYSSEQDFLSLGVRDLVKGENRLLLQNKSWADAEYCYDSIFSPDGSQIAYAVQVKQRLIQLRAVNSDGSSTRILRDGKDGLDYLPFGWTSDGNEILTHFSGPDKISGIAFVSAFDGSIKHEKALSLNVPWEARMSLSPDGRYVAGTYLPSEDSANQDILLLPLDGGRISALVEHPADDVLIGWSPDSAQVIFTSDRTGSVGIWTVRVSEGKAKGAPEFVRGNLGNIKPLGMTRDGRMYYGISSGSNDIFVASVDPATGKVLAPAVKAIRKYETHNSTPDWSPDGQFLACHSSRGKAANESPVLLIRSLRTNEVHELIPKTPGGRLAPYYLRWSPDGRSLLGGGRDENGQVGALHMIDARTGETRIIVRSDRNDGTGHPLAPDWSPDGKSINFIRIGTEFRRICNLDLETGIEKEIYRFAKASGPFWLASSPDGRELAVRAEGKIKILSRDGAESRELTEADSGTVLAWMPDGKNILFGKPQDGDRSIVELWRIPTAGGEPQKAGLSMSRLTLLRVSPDGKSVAFTASEQQAKSEVWVMENFLPGKR